MDAHRNAMPKKRKLVQRPPLTVERALTLRGLFFRPRKNGCGKKWSSVYLALVMELLRHSDAQKVTNMFLDWTYKIWC